MVDKLLSDRQDVQIWSAIEAGNFKQALKLVDKRLAKKRTSHLEVRVNGEESLQIKTPCYAQISISHFHVTCVFYLSSKAKQPSRHSRSTSDHAQLFNPRRMQ